MGCGNSQAAATVEQNKSKVENEDELAKSLSMNRRVPQKVEEEKVDYLALIGPAPEEFSRERVQFPGDENSLL